MDRNMSIIFNLNSGAGPGRLRENSVLAKFEER